MDELNRIGMTEDSPDEMNRMMRKHILHMMQEFANEGHSGFSAGYAINILTKLMDFKPLSPLTGSDDEWVKHDYGSGIMYQNKRRSSVFKDANDECYDIDGKVFWEWYKTDDGDESRSYYSCRESRMPVTFPYTVPDKPIYEYRQSNAEPKSPPQNEEGLL
jgi:hypothetical protein